MTKVPSISQITNKAKNIKPPENFPAELYAFPVISGYQSYDSYKKAPQENKKNSLKLDLFVLAGTSLGIFGGYHASSKLLQKTTKLSSVKQELIHSFGAPLGGTFTGFISGYYGNQMFPLKNIPAKKPEEHHEKSKSLTEKTIKEKKKEKRIKFLKSAGIFIMTTAGAIAGNRLSKYALKSKVIESAELAKTPQKIINGAGVLVGAALGLGAGDTLLGSKKIKLTQDDYSVDFLLTTASPSLGAFQANIETDFKTRVKNTFYEIISTVVAPSALLLPTMHLVKKNLQEGKPLNKKLKSLSKISNNPATQKFLAEKGIIMPVAIITYAAGRAVGDWFDKKVSQKIVEKDFWKNFEKMKADAIKSSMEGISSNDQNKTGKALEQLQKVRDIEKQAKENFSSSKKISKN